MNPFDSMNQTENKMVNKMNKNKKGSKNKANKNVNRINSTKKFKRQIQLKAQSKKSKISSKAKHNTNNQTKKIEPNKQNAITKPKQKRSIKLTGFTTIGISNENLAHLKAIKDVSHSNSLNDVITKLIAIAKPVVTNSKNREHLYKNSLKLHKTIIKLRK